MHQESNLAAPVRQRFWILLGCILLVGLTLRIVPSAGFKGLGFDENLYRDYVIALDQKGLGAYPEICSFYIKDQQDPASITKLPPTRFLYIFSSWIWKRMEFANAPPLPKTNPAFLDSDPALISLHRIACLFSCLFLVLVAVASRRMFDRRMQLGTTALIAFSPLLLQMAQHALIDGFLAFFAMLCLWLLWECLRNAGAWRWPLAYGSALILLVLTKENAFFVFVALTALLLINRWTKFGIVTWKLVLVHFLAPALGLGLLILLAGGVSRFILVYELLVSKAAHLQYAIQTGDGPWYRYLVDLMIISPLVLCLALGGIFTQFRGSSAVRYLVFFVVFSYAIMCNIPYAMNLRYATIWDLTLRTLAMAQLLWMAPAFGRRENLFVLVSVTALCLFDLNQYVVFFVDGKLYELVTAGLLEAVKILKDLR